MTRKSGDIINRLKKQKERDSTPTTTAQNGRGTEEQRNCNYELRHRPQRRKRKNHHEIMKGNKGTTTNVIHHHQSSSSS